MSARKWIYRFFVLQVILFALILTACASPQLPSPTVTPTLAIPPAEEFPPVAIVQSTQEPPEEQNVSTPTPESTATPGIPGDVVADTATGFTGR